MKISKDQREAWKQKPENDAFKDALASEIMPTGVLDLERLYQLAAKNGLGDLQSEYEHLNPGQIRMNIGNRLRPIWKSGDLKGLEGQSIPCAENGSHPFKNHAFTISHADDGKFVGQGLRAFFEYRELGIKDATQGKFGAHVIRAVPGEESPGAWHSHELEFQMVYVTKGWVVFEYEGEGEHMLRAGSCVLQPPGIKHREVRHSDDMELIEIISPADFHTQDETAP